MAFSFTFDIGIPKLRDLSLNVDFSFDLDVSIIFYK